MTFSHDGNQFFMSFYGKASAQNVVEGLNVINDPKCNNICPKCNKVLNVITICSKCNKLLSCQLQ